MPRDPEVLVRNVHEKERTSFREALERRDFVEAYGIYVEQRELPVLSGAEVTSLVQLISADSLLRKINGYEQPDSMKDVFWTIIEDVKERKVAGQMILWTHALDTLVTWNLLEEAEQLWSELQALPNRLTMDKNDALCIDSRVYGSAIKLYTAKGDFISTKRLYQEALEGRKLRPSLMIDQAMIAAFFENREVGEAYKAMDRTIREQRRVLRPAFFNAMMGLALDAEAVGVASEIFMKACNVRMSPSGSQVTRLLTALGRSRKDPVGSVMSIFKHYREVNGGRLPIEHVNCVISAIFAAAKETDSKDDTLSKVHEILQEMQKMGLRSSVSTVNILLAGYMDLGRYDLADELAARAELDDNSFRTMLKSLARSSTPETFNRVKSTWSSFEEHVAARQRIFIARDLQMLMRAAFGADSTAARIWIPDILKRHTDLVDSDSRELVYTELSEHDRGTFVKRGKSSAIPKRDERALKWLANEV